MTQSNSKIARLTRQAILEDILIIKNLEDKTLHLSDVCEFLEDKHDMDDISFLDINNYKVIDIEQFV